jgi:D-xylose transport system ATP-binding protein
MGEGELRGDFANDGLTQEAILTAAIEPARRAAAVPSNETLEA